MRALVLLLVVACSKTAPAPAPPPPPSPPAPPPVELADLISADAVGVLRQPPDQFAVLLYTRDLVKGPDGAVPTCWTDLERRVVAGYQVSLPVGSYFVLEGELPQEQVIDCAGTATRGLITGARRGDLVEFTTPSAPAYAAWRGNYVVLGNKAQVEQAVGTHTPDLIQRWRALIGEPAAAPVWIVRTDAAFLDLVGAPTTSYVIVIDTMEGPPKSFVAGRFVVHYASPQDADTGERHLEDWIARGKFPRKIQGPAEVVALYDQLATALQRAPIKRDGAALELRFDSDMFGGMWPQFANAAASLGM